MAFSPATLTYLRGLKRHNERPWFEAHRAEYEAVVKRPMRDLIEEMDVRLARFAAEIIGDPKRSMFRIYRDIRFSADKSPYKTHTAAHFFHRASKATGHAPGFYLHLAPGECFVGGGLWHPDTSMLVKLRDAMVESPAVWKRARRGLKLEGAVLGRPPRGYDPKHPLIDDLRRKDFVAGRSFTEAQVCSPRFMRDVVAECRRLSPLVEFLTKAVGLKW